MAMIAPQSHCSHGVSSALALRSCDRIYSLMHCSGMALIWCLFMVIMAVIRCLIMVIMAVIRCLIMAMVIFYICLRNTVQRYVEKTRILGQTLKHIFFKGGAYDL